MGSFFSGLSINPFSSNRWVRRKRLIAMTFVLEFASIRSPSYGLVFTVFIRVV